MAALNPGRAPDVFKDGPIDEPRPMRVVVIGAGFSGIIAAIRFLQYVKNVDLTVYEALAGVGGTWYANRYPGLACDIPAHCVEYLRVYDWLEADPDSQYQLTFHEKTDWSGFYATGPEIRRYIESVVDKFNLRPFIKLSHRLAGATYDEPTGKWNLNIEPTGSEPFQDQADVLFTGWGTLSRWRWPDIEGLESFAGKIMHSAQWETGEGTEGVDGQPVPWEETVKSWGDKRVGVIGVGSSAIQIVPALQPKVLKVLNYVRGKTWISPPFFGDRAGSNGRSKGSGNYIYSEKEKEEFTDPEFYKKFRRDLESTLNSIHVVTLKDHPASVGGKEIFKTEMLERLASRPQIAEQLIPDFSPGCRRLTPGPGYLESLCQDNVAFVHTPIARITPSGIETADGAFEALDVIVCATGFDTSCDPGIPIVGRGGVKLSDRYKPHARTYLSVAVDGFPNWFQALGPNSGVGSGSLLIVIERVSKALVDAVRAAANSVQYAVEATLKLQREHLKSMEPTKEAVDDWDAYIEEYFKKTVFGEKCRSWYKQGKEEGRVVALWPGSSLHAVRALQYPRWEDYTYEPLDASHRNRFFFVGSGSTVAEDAPDGDKAWYLGEVDVPPVPLHGRA
ncbi:hypothetical protein HMN09_00906100 [Mycena chlorophos]|uniref:FAD/NAD(P)-binding domain-containing protein n=1 Tax=Mycena chlorophos TaxID=658473 RepID=A0A8H6SQS9_MYCCL|nr:hypothetical protein HMN09_00906100 [Mycena chlorophos]